MFGGEKVFLPRDSTIDKIQQIMRNRNYHHFPILLCTGTGGMKRVLGFIRGRKRTLKYCTSSQGIIKIQQKILQDNYHTQV